MLILALVPVLVVVLIQVIVVVEVEVEVVVVIVVIIARPPQNELPPEIRRGGERERERTTEDKTGTKQPQTPQKHKNIRSPKRRWCSYTYREGNPSVRLEVPLSYTASVYKSYREGKLSVRLQASFFLYSFYTQFI